MTSTCVLKTRNKMYTWVTKYDYHPFFRFIMYYFCFIIIMKNSESVPPPKIWLKRFQSFKLLRQGIFCSNAIYMFNNNKIYLLTAFQRALTVQYVELWKFNSKARIADLRRKETIISIQRWILQTKTTPSADNRSDLLTSNKSFYVR